MRLPIRIGAPAAASLLVNGLMVAALLNLGMGQIRSRQQDRAITVMSLAMTKGVEDGAEEAESADEPAQKPSNAAPPPEPPPAAAIVPPMPVPGARAMPAAPPSQSAIAPAAPARSAAAPTARAMPVKTLSPAASSVPAVRQGARDGLDANAPPGTSRSYAARVRSWLLSHKTYPKRARMRHEEGVVRVFFVIDRAGRLMEGRVIAGSGFASLDEEAAAMLRRASPYPSAPKDVPGERIEITAPVEFTLPL